MSFKVPQKAILSQEQFEAFKTSKSRQQIVSYIEVLNESVVGVKLSDECLESEVVIGSFGVGVFKDWYWDRPLWVCGTHVAETISFDVGCQGRAACIGFDRTNGKEYTSR